MITVISIFSGNDGAKTLKPLRSMILTAISIFSGKDGLNL